MMPAARNAAGRLLPAQSRIHSFAYILCLSPENHFAASLRSCSISPHPNPVSIGDLAAIPAPVTNTPASPWCVFTQDSHFPFLPASCTCTLRRQDIRKRFRGPSPRSAPPAGRCALGRPFLAGRPTWRIDLCGARALAAGRLLAAGKAAPAVIDKRGGREKPALGRRNMSARPPQAPGLGCAGICRPGGSCDRRPE